MTLWMVLQIVFHTEFSFCQEVLDICFHFHIFFQTCNSETREDARTYMTVFSKKISRHGISLSSKELSSVLPDPIEDFCSSPSVFAFKFGAGEDDRPFRRL